jgi:hypothetical protein
MDQVFVENDKFVESPVPLIDGMDISIKGSRNFETDVDAEMVLKVLSNSCERDF